MNNADKFVLVHEELALNPALPDTSLELDNGAEKVFLVDERGNYRKLGKYYLASV